MLGEIYNSYVLQRRDLPESVTVDCDNGNDYDGRMGLRISAIFVILIGSLIGAVFPVYARRTQGTKLPEWPFFIAKYFGSGVIVATAFIHLLAPAVDALGSPCLGDTPLGEYDFAEGIVLMTIFSLFLVEILAMRYATFGGSPEGHSHGNNLEFDDEAKGSVQRSRASRSQSAGQIRDEEHLSHAQDHKDNDLEQHKSHISAEDYAAQLTAIFILEFGVIFHSIFIGLTLAVAGDEFTTLYIVLVFHQTFEGLGLGSRLAITPWPASKRWTPYFMGVGYAFSTPIAIAIGLGLRQTWAPGSETALVANGVFDAISAGILIYTGLVELMAHEFMFSEAMRKAKISVVMSAFGLMTLGAGLMALLGKWA